MKHSHNEVGATKSNQLSYEPPLIKDEISIWSLEGKTKKKKVKIWRVNI